MRSYIIGIAGTKGSGKDTVANMINYIFAKGVTNATYANYVLMAKKTQYTKSDRIIHFADVPKKIISLMFGIPIDKLNDRKYKDEMFYNLNSGTFLEPMTVALDVIKDSKYAIIDIDYLKSYSLAKAIKHNIGKIPIIKVRTLLQYIGTEIGRKQLFDDIWVKRCIANAVDVAEARRLCVIADVRFANEANAISNISNDYLYGGVIVLKRNINDSCEHESENIDFTGDFEIVNSGTLITLFYEVLDICQKII